jgi:hypothetical protein
MESDDEDSPDDDTRKKTLKRVDSQATDIAKPSSLPFHRPTDWDPAKCSPIYFGRSSASASEEAALRETKRVELRAREQRALQTAKVCRVGVLREKYLV